MRATPWTGECASVAVVLGVIGLYLDSPAAIAASMGLAALLCGQAALFLYRTARYANSLKVNRVLGKKPVFLGTPVEVRVRVTALPAPGLQVRIVDLPPRSAVYNPGDARVRKGESRYQARFMTPGEVRFRGLLLETADRFFSTTTLCASPRFAGENFTVRPAVNGSTELVAGKSGGMKELDRMGLSRGEGISGFRPYARGDDPALLDWKLTAKHGRPFVREPTAEVGGAPLVVVDLPRSEEPGGAAILSAAGEEIERVIREHGQCTLLLIAGGEVIDFRYREHDPVKLFRLLGVRQPEPVHPMYRVEDQVVLRERVRTAEKGILISSQRFAGALRATLGAGVRSVFEHDLDRALAAEHREVIVYTSSTGDPSHLNLIAAAARRRRQRLVVRVPRSLKGSIPSLSPYSRVEAV